MTTAMTSTTATATPTPAEAALRPHAEDAFARELDALAKGDDRPRPPRWNLSPQAVATYLLGGQAADGTEITPKYIGPRRLIEVAVATLATDRGLLLLGVPGTAKSWVSEHLSAAVCGDSTLLVQGTAGTSEEAMRYGWNYAQLLAHGPVARRTDPLADDDRDGGRQGRPGRGTDPHPGRRAGHADHHLVREDAADPGTRRRGPGGQGLHRHRDRE